MSDVIAVLPRTAIVRTLSKRQYDLVLCRERMVFVPVTAGLVGAFKGIVGDSLVGQKTGGRAATARTAQLLASSSDEVSRTKDAIIIENDSVSAVDLKVGRGKSKASVSRAGGASLRLEWLEEHVPGADVASSLSNALGAKVAAHGKV